MQSAVLLLACLYVGQGADAVTKRQIDALIVQLGHREYRQRELAGKQLLEIGPAASEAIKAGQQSEDAEISERCRKLYPLIWTMGLEKRLKVFVGSEGTKNTEELPLAKKWLEIVGDSKSSREMYANMMRVNSTMLKAAEDQPAKLPTIVAEYAKSMYTRSGGSTAIKLTGMATEPEVSTFLFLGAIGEVRRLTLPGMTSIHYYQFLNAESLAKSLDEPATSKETRLLFSRWLEKERYTTVMRRSIEIAAEHKVNECAAPLIKIAKDANTTPYVRATALMGLVRFGDKKTINDLTPFLKDNLQIATVMVNNIRGSVQLRDVALGSAIQLSGQSLKDFGFERDLPRAGQLPPSYVYYAFSSDEKRAEAFKKWDEWAKSHLGK